MRGPRLEKRDRKQPASNSLTSAYFLLIDAQVIWKRLYSSCSGMDTGTLFQLRNLINRRNVITDVSKDRTACEEFMQLATIAHVMSAAIQIAGCLTCPQRSCQVISLSYIILLIHLSHTVCTPVLYNIRLIW